MLSLIIDGFGAIAGLILLACVLLPLIVNILDIIIEKDIKGALGMLLLFSPLILLLLVSYFYK